MINITKEFNAKKLDPNARAYMTYQLELDQGYLVATDGIVMPEELAIFPGYYDADEAFDGDNNYYDGGTAPFVWGPWVIQFGALDDTASPGVSDTLGSLFQAERGAWSVALENAGKRMSRMITQHWFLGRPAKVYINFMGLAFSHRLCLAAGVVTRAILAADRLTLEHEKL